MIVETCWKTERKGCGESFFGKLGNSKVPCILGIIENHKNAQDRMHSEKEDDLRRPKVFNSG